MSFSENCVFMDGVLRGRASDPDPFENLAASLREYSQRQDQQHVPEEENKRPFGSTSFSEPRRTEDERAQDTKFQWILMPNSGSNFYIYTNAK